MTKPTLQQLIASARGDEPTPEQLKKLDARIASLLPPIGGGSSGPAGGGGVVLKWIAAGVVVVGGGVAVQQTVAHRSRPTPPAPQLAVTEPPTPPPDAPPPDAPPPAIDAAVSEVAPPAPPPPPEGAPEGSLTNEAALLDRARTALQHGDARAALATCNAHATRFKHPVLREERERIAIEALVALGRHDEARARAQRFDLAFPNSVQSERIHALLHR